MANRGQRRLDRVRTRSIGVHGPLIMGALYRLGCATAEELAAILYLDLFPATDSCSLTISRAVVCTVSNLTPRSSAIQPSERSGVSASCASMTCCEACIVLTAVVQNPSLSSRSLLRVLDHSKQISSPLSGMSLVSWRLRVLVSPASLILVRFCNRPFGEVRFAREVRR